jgi:hypothetical protein
MLTEIEDLNIVFTNSVVGVESKAPLGYVSSKEETNNRRTNQ